MKQRGRKQNLAVVQDAPVSAQDRPEPPPDLTPEQRLEWISVVNSLRADWFPVETHGVLSQYCKHMVASRHVAELIADMEQSDAIDIDSYDKLLKMQERESRILVSLATKMRITQQATYHPETQTKKGTTRAKSPWASD
jgi:hypothetical protein